MKAGLIGVSRAHRSLDLLDPEIVADWFFSSLGDVNLAEATAEADLPLDVLAIERIRALRRIKNDLNVVRLMGGAVSALASPRDEWAAAWLRVRASLPWVVDDDGVSRPTPGRARGERG